MKEVELDGTSVGFAGRSRQRLGALDGLRALSILAVFGLHRWPNAVPGGWVGVDVFFVLSGYLITALLARELEATGQVDIAAFAARRSLRIVPALLAMLLIHSIYILFATRNPHHQIYVATMALSFVTNWVRAFSGFAEGPLAHTWSLSTEEQFYLLWPFVLLAIGTRRPGRWVVGLIAAVACWRAALALGGASPDRTYNGFDTHADGLLIGCLLALCPLRPAWRRIAGRWVALPLAVLTAVLVEVGNRSVGVQVFGMLGCAVAAGWLVAAALEPGNFAQMLSLAPLRFLGRISYSLYLWHLPILKYGPTYLPSGWIGDVLLVLLSLLAAMLSYGFIERPFLALRLRLPARLAFRMTGGARLI